jgi:hypothetical protein
MRATINGTKWVADTAVALQKDNCLILYGWTGSGLNIKSVMLTLSSSMTAHDSCPAGGDYAIGGGNELMRSLGTIYLDSKTNLNLQGRFAFNGVIFRSTDTTFITNGEFNLNIKK